MAKKCFNPVTGKWYRKHKSVWHGLNKYCVRCGQIEKSIVIKVPKQKGIAQQMVEQLVQVDATKQRLLDTYKSPKALSQALARKLRILNERKADPEIKKEIQILNTLVA